jgi:hypothetical protein
MRVIPIRFRWEVKQVDAKVVEMQVPTSRDGVPIITPAFATGQNLTDGEVENAEFEVLRSIAVLKD